MTTPTSSDPTAGAARSIRLTLTYDEQGVRVVDRTPVSKPVPPSVPSAPSFGPRVAGAPPPLPDHAVVAELRSADDATTYRQIIEQAIPRDVEVFDPDVEHGMYRRPQPLSMGVFTVIVPDDQAAQDVVLLARDTGAPPGPSAAPPPGDAAAGAPVELARFSLRPGGG